MTHTFKSRISGRPSSEGRGEQHAVVYGDELVRLQALLDPKPGHDPGARASRRLVQRLVLGPRGAGLGEDDVRDARVVVGGHHRARALHRLDVLLDVRGVLTGDGRVVERQARHEQVARLVRLQGRGGHRDGLTRVAFEISAMARSAREDYWHRKRASPRGANAPAAAVRHAEGAKGDGRERYHPRRECARVRSSVPNPQ